MIKNRFLLSVIVFVAVFTFCDKGDKYDLRTLFPGPGFEKGWSWIDMPVEYNHEQITAGKAGDKALKFRDEIEKVGKAVYIWGSHIDSSFSVIIYKVKNDSIAKVLSDSVAFGETKFNFGDDNEHTILSLVNKQYIIVIKPRSKSKHIMSAIKIVAEKINGNINK